jgi:hypothetical protein
MRVMTTAPLDALREATEDGRPVVVAAALTRFASQIDPTFDVDKPLSDRATLTVRVALEQLSSLRWVTARAASSPEARARLSRECPLSLISQNGGFISGPTAPYVLDHECTPVVIAAADAWRRLGFTGHAVKTLAELMADGGVRDRLHLDAGPVGVLPPESAQNLHAVDFASTRVAVWERLQSWTPYRGPFSFAPALSTQSSQTRAEALALMHWWTSEGIALFPLDVRGAPPASTARSDG